MVEFDVTERLPTDLGGRTTPQSAVFRVAREAFDIAIGDLPFNLYANAEHPYERSTAQYRKDQFDTSRLAGEQSLSEWWLRSQNDFSGGDGITYYEPLEGEGSETRFYDSRGVNVFDYPEVQLLNEQTVAFAGGADLEFVGIGESVGLFRSANTFRIINENGTTTAVTPLGSTPRGIARVPGHNWLIGHTTGVSRMSSTGTTAAVITGAPAPLVPYWAKDRIFAVESNKVYTKPLAGGALNLTPTTGDLLYEHPTTSWSWSSIVETGGAVWMSGRQGAYSAVYVTTLDASGDTPELTSPTPAIRMPAGEYVVKMESYLDFLLICTNLGFRVAITDGDRAQLGPLLWDDQGSFSVSARGEYAWVGLANGLTRRVALGIVTSPDELQFAWANDAEVPGGGNVAAVGFVGNKLTLAVNDKGCTIQGTNLVSSGYISTGFIRFGTLEPKHFYAVKIVGDVTDGSISVAGATALDAYSEMTSVADFSPSTEIGVSLPGGSLAERLSLKFTLHRDGTTPTAGPKFDGYQLRALPTPAKRQRLIALPLLCQDVESNRHGVKRGKEGFAYARLRDLELLEETGLPVIYQDFRTGESRSVVVEQIHFVNPDSPDKTQSNFGGVLQLTLRTLD